ncbi:MAG: hypothetical protein BGO69_15920 [Bacteroidetes bacterium 46-16]|nr:MAG: hypothetical protein BGO69_15920 [Bacteroidetes bacterium 46-16]
MTWQEKFTELQKAFIEKGNVYIPLEKEITSVKGFGDMDELSAYYKAKKEWQLAGNQYNDFLSRIHGKNIDPNGEYNPAILLN